MIAPERSASGLTGPPKTSGHCARNPSIVAFSSPTLHVLRGASAGPFGASLGGVGNPGGTTAAACETVVVEALSFRLSTGCDAGAAGTIAELEAWTFGRNNAAAAAMRARREEGVITSTQPPRSLLAIAITPLRRRILPGPPG
jgi:hypothetical protein